jgi:hypothetical protein
LILEKSSQKSDPHSAFLYVLCWSTLLRAVKHNTVRQWQVPPPGHGNRVPLGIIRSVHSGCTTLQGRMKDYYAVLGVAADANSTALKTAYRRRAAALHPDRNPSTDAAAQFREVQEAYELLGDPARRQDYDENRRRSLLDDPLATAQDIWKNYMSKVLA